MCGCHFKLNTTNDTVWWWYLNATNVRLWRVSIALVRRCTVRRDDNTVNDADRAEQTAWPGQKETKSAADDRSMSLVSASNHLCCNNDNFKQHQTMQQMHTRTQSIRNYTAIVIIIWHHLRINQDPERSRHSCVYVARAYDHSIRRFSITLDHMLCIRTITTRNHMIVV